MNEALEETSHLLKAHNKKDTKIEELGVRENLHQK